MMNTEKKLYRLFEYQRFANNPKLQKIIDSAHGKDVQQLDDEDLDKVAAAGEIKPLDKRERRL